MSRGLCEYSNISKFIIIILLRFVVTNNHLGLLFYNLSELQCDAKDFGLKLGLKYNEIEAVIKKSLMIKTPHDCLQHVFVLWLKQPSQNCTWQNLVKALRNVGEQTIANKIEERYSLNLDESGMVILITNHDYVIPPHLIELLFNQNIFPMLY